MEVPFFDLNFDEKEEEAVMTVLRSKWISMGSKTQELEQAFAEQHNVKYGVALANCTVSLHLALKLIGVKVGDEVIVPSLSFVATASCVCHLGAKPVFADVSSLNDWTISPEDIENKITPKTKAIIAMHYGGYGSDMPKILEIAKKYNLKVIEDACHAPLADYKGEKLGSFGDIACYSFYSNKNISTGEGGMLITNNAEYAERAKILRTHGMTSTAYDRVNGKGFYDVLEVGYNYRMDDIHSVIGLVQLEKAKSSVALRQGMADRYRENLKESSDLVIPFADYEGNSANHVFGIFVRNGDVEKIKKQLKEAGITTSNHYPPIHKFSSFQSKNEVLPLTEEIASRQISLPIYPRMTFEQVDYVCEKIKKLFINE
tara:strand:- start:15082 stop:16200 length:1119 start_codon:yes stop_codon:yes gene_type:complete